MFFLQQPGDSVTLVDVCVDTEDLHEFASGEESELESDTEERQVSIHTPY